MTSVRQRIIPMIEFAQAMRKSSESFAKRIREFEAAFGTVDPDTLAVIAQATYFCWFEVEYEKDYFEVCRAIGLGSPTSLYLCGQVSPRRWTEMNTYVVGVQRWLGVERPLFCGLSGAKLERIGGRLGDRTPVKAALAELFVCHLAAGLSVLQLSKLSGRDDPDEERYFDFTPWYSIGDGKPYILDDHASVLKHLGENARRELHSVREDAEELIAGMLEESQPACQHRFSRYQDIKIASIGAVKWRGNIPLDVDVPKYKARDWFEKKADLRGWLSDTPPTTDLLASFYGALGTPTERKKTIIRDFFCGPPEGGFEWLVARAKRDGTTVSALFSRDAQQRLAADATERTAEG